MEHEKLAELIDQQRWMINSGLIPDSVKNQLFFFGSIVHKDVQAVELAISADSKVVDYVIYVSKSTIKKIEKVKKLSTATSLFGLWRYKRFLEKEGSLDFSSILNQFVSDFCGPKWSANVTVLDFDAYVDSIGEDGGPGREGQQLNKLLD